MGEIADLSFYGILRGSGMLDDEILELSRRLDPDEQYEFAVEVKRKGKDAAIENLSTPGELKYDFKTKEMEKYAMYRTVEYAKIELELGSGQGSIIEGVYKCSRCGCMKISVVTRQMRRADEPETHFFACTNCPNRWRDG